MKKNYKSGAIILASILIYIGVTAEAFAQNRILERKITKISSGVHLLKKADQYYHLGKIQKARKYYKRSLSLGLDKAEETAALSNICALYNVEEHYNLARHYCTKALKISPYHWRSYNNRGAAYFGLKLFAKAAHDFEKASHLNSTDETLEQNIKLAESNLSR